MDGSGFLLLLLLLPTTEMKLSVRPPELYMLLKLLLSPSSLPSSSLVFVFVSFLLLLLSSGPNINPTGHCMPAEAATTAVACCLALGEAPVAATALVVAAEAAAPAIEDEEDLKQQMAEDTATNDMVDDTCSALVVLVVLVGCYLCVCVCVCVCCNNCVFVVVGRGWL